MLLYNLDITQPFQYLTDKKIANERPNHYMNKYFDRKIISKSEESYFDDLANLIANREGAIFAGYPLIFNHIDNKINRLHGLLIIDTGIFVFIKTEDEKNEFKQYIIQQISKANVDFFSKIISNVDKMILFVNIGDFSFLDDSVLVCFNNHDIGVLISLFQNIFNLTKKDSRDLLNNNSYGAMIVRRSGEEAKFDEKQFQFVYAQEYENVNIRVRGLAGSGKTILLAEKTAWLHYRDKSLQIAYVFYSKSLRQTIEKFVIQFYKQFDEQSTTFDRTKINVIHGWGNYMYEGLYSKVCNLIGICNTSYEEEKDFGLLCSQIVNYIVTNHLENKIKIYDYIMIDEAQDFSPDFFKLAKMCLKPTGNLIYAYDELQILNEPKKKMPSVKQIFEEKPYKDLDLSLCYRSPLEIIVAAHALGLGTYHKNEKNEASFINVVMDASIWKAIGYRNENGVVKYGSQVSFKRDFAIKNEIGDDAISCKLFANQHQQLQFVLEESINLIKSQDIKPDDILIIDLDGFNIGDHYDKLTKLLSTSKSLDGESRANLFTYINKDSGISFRVKNTISVCSVYRAKGNESPIVFVINADNSDVVLSYNRNRLFTAMTRAKFKVYLCGTNKIFMNSIINEIEETKANGYRLNFKYPTKAELEQYANKVYTDTELSKAVEDAYAKVNNSKILTNTDFLKLYYSNLSEVDKKRFIEELLNDEKE